MRAIILSAGQGRRLGALTENTPKCLLPLGGRALVEWQVQSLAAGGVGDIVVVTGFGADQVDAELARAVYRGLPDVTIRTLRNPDYAVSDNLVSCWAARAEMDSDFLIVNGDTLFEPAIVSRLCASGTRPISVAVVRKAVYDADDMKVSCVGDEIRHVAKTIPAEEVSAEAIGLSCYRGRGAGLMRETVIAFAGRPDGPRLWYLSAVNDLARQGHVGAVFMGELASAEVDYPPDVATAENVALQRIEPLLFPKPDTDA